MLLTAGAVLCAMAIDVRLGEPRAGWHPVVWIGLFLQRVGRRLPMQPPGHAFAAGALAWWAGALCVGAVGFALDQALRALAAESVAATLLAMIVLGYGLKIALAWAMLRDEVLAVEAALSEQGLPAGRARLARLVSRDVGALSATQVRESAIESLAENLNDSCVAPLFWFCCFGLPGALLYRYANTADAMWGYKGRWEWAGKWAARADDVLSWLPARLSAIAIGFSGRLGDWPRLPAQARLTPSPNGGWPMAAMALSLGVRLGKPDVYVLNDGARVPQGSDVRHAVRIAAGALRSSVLLMVVILVVWH